MTNAPPNNTTHQTADAAVKPIQEPTPETLGQFVARLRTQRQLSRERLAEATQLPIDDIAQIEDETSTRVLRPSVLWRIDRALNYFTPLSEADYRLMSGWHKTCRRRANAELFKQTVERAAAAAQTLRELKYKLYMMHSKAEPDARLDLADMLRGKALAATGCCCGHEDEECMCPSRKQPKVAAFKVDLSKWYRREVWEAMDRAFDTSEDAWERRGMFLAIRNRGLPRRRLFS